MSDESDIELTSNVIVRKNDKLPSSPSDEVLKKDKKYTTKEMLEEALTSLKNRKGVSLYALKKYMKLHFDFNTAKMSYLLKKQLQSGIDDGTIAQVKGVGASGSFNLVTAKKNPNKTKKKPDKKSSEKNKDKPTKSIEKEAKVKKITIKDKIEQEPKTSKSKDKNVKVPQNKTKKLTKMATSEENDAGEKPPKIAKKGKIKKSDAKKEINQMASVKQTPARKKVTMMKRKSIGSILKTPKMKPRAK